MSRLRSARVVHVEMKDHVARVGAAEDGERLARRKRTERHHGVAEILRDVIAVAVDERHPVRGRIQHVVRMAREVAPLGPIRQLDHRSVWQRREQAIHGRERLGVAKLPQRHRRQFGGRDRRDRDTGKKRTPLAREQRCEQRRAQHDQCEHHHDAHPPWRAHEREDRNRLVEDRVQARHPAQTTTRTRSPRSARTTPNTSR